MALELDISACFTDCCSVLQITDVSGIVGVLVNAKTGDDSTGWETGGATTVDPSAITSATITLTTPAGTLTDYDVTAEVVAYVITVPLYLDFATATFDAAAGYFVDGLYTIVYTIVDGSANVYTVTLREFFYCRVKCCVDNMWKQLSDKVGCCDYSDWMERCLNAEGMLTALRSSAGCSNTVAIGNILDTLEEICSFNQCECS